MKGLFNSDDEPLEPETSIDIYYGVWFTWLLDKEWFNFEPEPIISIYYSVALGAESEACTCMYMYYN